MILGIDIGGTTTDIVGSIGDSLIEPLTVTASDPVTSAAGALGKLVADRSIKLSDIERIAVTGVGANRLGDNLLGLPAVQVSEFDAIGTGGAYLSGRRRAIVVSLGTGTAVVYVDDGKIEHWGGTGVGGGTLIGLAKRMIGISDFGLILRRADEGNLDKVDLCIADITDPALVDMPPDTTASNFGKVADDATDADLARAIVNLVCQTVGIVAAGAARAVGTDQIVVTGKMATAPFSAQVFRRLGELYGLTYTIPRYAAFATAIGAAVAISPS
jgi:type II pantothenate kinase